MRRHKSLERSLRSRGVYDEFNLVMEEYFEKNHTDNQGILPKSWNKFLTKKFFDQSVWIGVY